MNSAQNFARRLLSGWKLEIGAELDQALSDAFLYLNPPVKLEILEYL